MGVVMRLQGSGERPGPAIADRDIVDPHNRHDVGSRAGQEGLGGSARLIEGEDALNDGIPLAAGDGADGAARDAVEDRVGRRPGSRPPGRP